MRIVPGRPGISWTLCAVVLLAACLAAAALMKFAAPRHEKQKTGIGTRPDAAEHPPRRTPEPPSHAGKAHTRRIVERLVPRPQQIIFAGETMPRPTRLSIQADSNKQSTLDQAARPACAWHADRLAKDLVEICGVDARVGGDGMPVRVKIQHGIAKPEGYSLKIARDSMTLTAADEAGLFYAAQTLVQILAFSPDALELLQIRDWPHYRTREVMLDMGRAPYSMKLLRRVIRIMARLKLNGLHLHLYDDHLNSLRFKKLPLGKENPRAISIDDLAEIVSFARRHHIAVVPELEAWGHAGAILYHYPELYGASAANEGYSFGIGESLYDLLEKMFDEVIPVLEPECAVHVGLDEARWALLPSVPPERESHYSPKMHVVRLHEILQKLGRKHGRSIRMRLWSSHGGWFVLEPIRDKVTLEPWQYYGSHADDIRIKLLRYGGAGKPAFVMGAGMSGQHPQGAYTATRLWCQGAMHCPNVEGVNICIWETNNVADQLVGVYAGADYAWTPRTPETLEQDPLGEKLRGRILHGMKQWQTAFPEARSDRIRADMGAEVHRGFYVTGPLAGKPVAPTCTLPDPRTRKRVRP